LGSLQFTVMVIVSAFFMLSHILPGLSCYIQSHKSFLYFYVSKFVKNQLGTRIKFIQTEKNTWFFRNFFMMQGFMEPLNSSIAMSPKSALASWLMHIFLSNIILLATTIFNTLPTFVLNNQTPYPTLL